MLAEDWRDATTRVGSPRRRTRLPDVPAWLLVGAAFVAGAALAAAGFVTVWRDEAGKSADAQAQLSAQHASVAELRDANATLAQKLAAETRLRLAADARAVVMQRKRAAAEKTLHDLSTQVDAAVAQARAAGSAVTSSATALANDVQGLSAYLSQTEPSQLDPGYLATQLAYLKKLAARLETSAPSLSAQLADLGKAASS